MEAILEKFGDTTELQLSIGASLVTGHTYPNNFVQALSGDGTWGVSFAGKPLNIEFGTEDEAIQALVSAARREITAVLFNINALAR